jgi:hypothetical protein
MWTSNVLEYRSFIEAQAAEVVIERGTARQGICAAARERQGYTGTFPVVANRPER